MSNVQLQRLGTCRVLRSGRGQQQRLLRHDDPGNDIRNQPDARHEKRNQPQNTHQGYVNIKIFGKTKADAGVTVAVPAMRITRAYSERHGKTEVVLERHGDTYRLDKVWIQDQLSGYRFLTPTL